MANLNISSIIQESLMANAEQESNESLGDTLKSAASKAGGFLNANKGKIGAGAGVAAGLGAAGYFGKKAYDKKNETKMDKFKAGLAGLSNKAKDAAGAAGDKAKGAAGAAQKFVASNKGKVAAGTLAAIGAGVGAKALLKHLRSKKKKSA